MSEHHRVPAPTETVYLARPSYAPAFLALGILGLVAGIFAEGFMFPAWVFSIAGACFVIGALYSLIWRGAHSFYRLPRKQDARAAVLPVSTFTAPKGE